MSCLQRGSPSYPLQLSVAGSAVADLAGFYPGELDGSALILSTPTLSGPLSPVDAVGDRTRREGPLKWNDRQNPPTSGIHSCTW